MWGGASDESEEEDDDLAVDSKGATQNQVQRSGKLLVLQQILPLWHAQVWISPRDVTHSPNRSTGHSFVAVGGDTNLYVCLAESCNIVAAALKILAAASKTFTGVRDFVAST